MTQIPYVLPQLCTYIDRDYFEMLVNRYHANAYVKSFSCWNQLATMTWAHLTRRVSLRDIECSLRGHRSKLYRMGIGKNVSRNTIANANARREVAVFRELAQRMMEKASKTSVKNDELAEIGARFKVNVFFCRGFFNHISGSGALRVVHTAKGKGRPEAAYPIRPAAACPHYGPADGA